LPKKDGEMINNKNEILERWNQYFQELLKGKEGNDEADNPVETSMEEHQGSQEGICLTTVEEMEEAIDKLKNNKAPGSDNINADLIKSSKPVLINILHKIIEKVWETETIPQEWEEELICPIHRKGDPLECQNYRCIILLNTTYKVFSNILYTRLEPYVKKVTGSYQCGFREGKLTTAHIQALHQVLERTREFKIDTFHLFMQEFGIPVKLINLTRTTLKRVKCRIKLQGYLSEPFLTQRGLRQWDALACLLFNIALEKVIRDSGIEKRGIIYYRSVQVLAYADDLDISRRSERDVKEAFIKLNNEAQKMGLNINAEKTKYMEITAKPIKNKYLKVGNYRFEKVTKFKYLGTMISYDNTLDNEIHQIVAG
jgi:sorting nexin-29